MDFLSALSQLTQLDVSYGLFITTLDLTHYPNLTLLKCDSSKLTWLTNLILSPDNQLNYLDCYGNFRLKSDFLFRLKPQQMAYLNLGSDSPSPAEIQLAPFLREGERLERSKFTGQLAPNEVN